MKSIREYLTALKEFISGDKMQIITGKYRGRKLVSLDTEKTRPTLARVKESLFSMVDEKIAGATVLDLFAGSGALGIEALSRGAEKVYFVDNNVDAKKVIQTNLRNVKENFNIEICDFKNALDKFCQLGVKFDIVFLDPPYQSDFGDVAIRLLDEKHLLFEGSVVCFEYQGENHLQSVSKCYKILKSKRYADKMLTILEYGSNGRHNTTY